MEWSWKDVVTAAVAIYGAVLSTFNFATALLDRRIRLKVDVMEGVAVGQGPLTGRQLRIAATNFGRRPVTLTQCCLQVKGQRTYLIMNNAMSVLPKEIKEGQFHAFTQPVENLFSDGHRSQDVLSLRAIWYDSTGRYFRGTWIKVHQKESTSAVS